MNTSFNRYITIAAILGALAVMLGAFGAHGLKALITPDKIDTFETGVRYHFYHTFVLLLLAWRMAQQGNAHLKIPFWLILLGIVFFSGSLYLMATRVPLHIEHWSFLGPITPIGGVLFIVGWLWIAYLSAVGKA